MKCGRGSLQCLSAATVLVPSRKIFQAVNMKDDLGIHGIFEHI